MRRILEEGEGGGRHRRRREDRPLRSNSARMKAQERTWQKRRFCAAAEAIADEMKKAPSPILLLFVSLLLPSSCPATVPLLLPR